MDPTWVVGALIVREGKVLLGRRTSKRAIAPGVWDIFGGHVERGERLEVALARELDEELGIRPRRAGLLCVLDDPNPRMRDAAFSIFVIEDWDGVLHNRNLLEHSEIRWFTAEKTEHLLLAHSAYPSLCRQVLSDGQDGWYHERDHSRQRG